MLSVTYAASAMKCVRERACAGLYEIVNGPETTGAIKYNGQCAHVPTISARRSRRSVEWHVPIMLQMKYFHRGIISRV
jgi:hypothetical protein